jgi:hypothetical protein
LAQKWGTDKWFYYTAFYHELLKDRRHKVKKVLELGIGSPATMLDSLSRMGITEYKPGASLFMWEEYFPKAEIYGLDIDRSILFNKGRIITSYFDQREPSTYPNFTGHHFDLIVEDGLHEKEAQLTALETLMPCLEPDGIYIMEDVGYLARACRIAFLREISYPAQLAEFHNPALGSHIAACIVVRP